MAELDKIEKIKKIGKAAAKKPIELPEPELVRMPPNKEKFDNLMRVENKVENLQVAKTEVKAPRTSLVNESPAAIQQTQAGKAVTPAEFVAQTEGVVRKIDEAKSKLQTPDLQIKGSVQHLMRNKLSHVNENLRIAFSKTNLEYTQPQVTLPKNPVENFLGLLTDGQAKLSTLGSEVARWHATKTEINPAMMLMLQIKVGQIQQEIEFFTSLLNKALESTKTIMNVQV